MSSLNFISILGRQPELGVLELEALLGSEAISPFGRQAVLVDRFLDIDRLGGSLKYGEIIYRGAIVPLHQLPVDTDKLPMNNSKTPFALSVYGSNDSAQRVFAAGLQMKKQLKPRGSVRLVTPSKGLAVSAAELRHNHVLANGFELMIVCSGPEMIIARTVGVQNIDWYSKRDYDRPARSAKVGMLPPKLAQILVNTTKNQVYDPFCGTGVILQEALLVGREAHGSDLSMDMSDSTRANLSWLEGQVSGPLPEWGVKVEDARNVRLPAGVSVVTEGYLGPHLTNIPATDELSRIKSELHQLYSASLASWAEQLPVAAEVTICVPAWRLSGSWDYLGIVDELDGLGYTLRSFKHVRAPLLYARKDQLVGRQLLILRKK